MVVFESLHLLRRVAVTYITAGGWDEYLSAVPFVPMLPESFRLPRRTAMLLGRLLDPHDEARRGSGSSHTPQGVAENAVSCLLHALDCRDDLSSGSRMVECSAWMGV